MPVPNESSLNGEIGLTLGEQVQMFCLSKVIAVSGWALREAIVSIIDPSLAPSMTVTGAGMSTYVVAFKAVPMTLKQFPIPCH